MEKVFMERLRADGLRAAALFKGKHRIVSVSEIPSELEAA